MKLLPQRNSEKRRKDRQREIERQYRKQRAIGVDFGNTRLGDEPIADSNMVSNQAAAEAVNENDSATFGESLTNIDINNQDDLVPKDRVEAVKEPYRRTSKKKSVAKILVLRVLYLMVTVMALVNWQIIIIVRKYMKYI